MQSLPCEARGEVKQAPLGCNGTCDGIHIDGMTNKPTEIAAYCKICAKWSGWE